MRRRGELWQQGFSAGCRPSGLTRQGAGGRARPAGVAGRGWARVGGVVVGASWETQPGSHPHAAPERRLGFSRRALRPPDRPAPPANTQARARAARRRSAGGGPGPPRGRGPAGANGPLSLPPPERRAPCTRWPPRPPFARAAPRSCAPGRRARCTGSSRARWGCRPRSSRRTCGGGRGVGWVCGGVWRASRAEALEAAGLCHSPITKQPPDACVRGGAPARRPPARRPPPPLPASRTCAKRSRLGSRCRRGRGRRGWGPPPGRGTW